MMSRGWASGVWRLAIVGVLLVTSGCAVKLSQRSPWDIQQIHTLSEQLEQFRTLAQLKTEEADRLRQAKTLLDERLSPQIAGKDVSVGFDERGLVVRVLDRILFGSGKAQLRQEAHPVLEQVARVLNKEVVDQPIAIEGHTDNEPITHSRWKDNWELSLARARSVLTHLVKEGSVDPARLSAVGYGEYRPIASNETRAGRRANRRVEIVVLPRGTTVQGPAGSEEAAQQKSAYTK